MLVEGLCLEDGIQVKDDGVMAERQQNISCESMLKKVTELEKNIENESEEEKGDETVTGTGNCEEHESGHGQNQASDDGRFEEKSGTKNLPRSQRKRQRYEERKDQMKEMRKAKKQEKKRRIRSAMKKSEDDGQEHKSKRAVKAEVRRKCEAALELGQKICLDCSLEDSMSIKEKGKLAMQIGRLYGANKKYNHPAHIYLTGLEQGGQLYLELISKNDGFLNYLIDIEVKQHTELFPLDKITVLSPDSETVLKDIEPDRIYVIGGLVDEVVTKNKTLLKADKAKISTARLPIDEFMVKIDQPSHSKILAVNVVFDILMTYVSTKSWMTAFSTHFPKRKGFVVRQDSTI